MKPRTRRPVAKHLGTQHRQFIVKPDAAADLPKLAAVFGEPFADSSALPTHYLSRETRQHVKVALSGDGGDELFAGYDRYRAVALAGRFRYLPRWLRRTMGLGLRPLLPGTHPKSRGARLKRFLATLDEPPDRRYASYMRLFDHTLLGNLRPPEMSSDGDCADYLIQPLHELRAKRDMVQSALALDRVTYLPEDLLVKLDRSSMLHALEVRSPFMDHELVHFAASLPTRALLGRGKKPLLREAFAMDLPRQVFRRPKMGFAVPIGEWFRGSLRSMLRDSLFASDSFASNHFNRSTIERLIDEHETESADHSQRLYGLLMLELWHQTAKFTVAQPPG